MHFIRSYAPAIVSGGCLNGFIFKPARRDFVQYITADEMYWSDIITSSTKAVNSALKYFFISYYDSILNSVN